MLNIVIAGSSGRMGHALLEAVLQSPDLRLHGALDCAGSAVLGRDAGELVGAPCGVKISADTAATLNGANVLVDFTRPEASMNYLAACRQAGVALVLGTTGFSAAQKAEIETVSRDVPIVFAPNMSVGINLLINLVTAAARVLAPGCDIEVTG